MVSKILMTLCVVFAAVAVSQAQWGPGAWGPPAAGGWGPQAAGGWGPPAAGGWGAPAAGGWGAPAAGGWGPMAAGGRPAAGANPWIPPWIASAPWMPQWTSCTTVGSSCVDCNTKQVCTKIGGIKRACTDPTLPYCNLGECSATPTAECAPAPATTASAGAV